MALPNRPSGNVRRRINSIAGRNRVSTGRLRQTRAAERKSGPAFFSRRYFSVAQSCPICPTNHAANLGHSNRGQTLKSESNLNIFTFHFAVSFFQSTLAAAQGFLQAAVAGQPPRKAMQSQT